MKSYTVQIKTKNSDTFTDVLGAIEVNKIWALGYAHGLLTFYAYSDIRIKELETNKIIKTFQGNGSGKIN